MDDTDTMRAGFAEAVRTRDPAAKKADIGLGRVRKKRIRKDGVEPSDPKSRAVIEKNSLQAVVDRLVKLNNEKAEVQDSIKAEFASAKDKGYDVKALRLTVKRAMETEDQKAAREDTEATFEQMLAALGMLADLPLGEAAMRSVAPA